LKTGLDPGMKDAERLAFFHQKPAAAFRVVLHSNILNEPAKTEARAFDPITDRTLKPHNAAPFSSATAFSAAWTISRAPEA
jgi:hypothetical protein